MTPHLPPPTLRLRIDEAALAHNWRALQGMSAPGRAGVAVKANCYGLGIDRCLPVLRDAGAREVFVAHWQEVPAALRHVPPERIAVLHGATSAAEAAYARAVGVRPVVNSPAQAKLWHESGGRLCHLMVDTGINRLGVRLEELADPAIAALQIDILMSHLACADEPDSAMNGTQLDLFREAVARVPHRAASLANSAGIALGENYAFDLTRPGLALYGGVPHPGLGGVIHAVAHPEAALIAVHRIAAGETVGYNATFTAPRAMRVGVVSLGYADGLLRSWRGGAFAFEGRSLPILGTVSMDMTVIDLSEAPSLREGDWVSLRFALPDAARHTGLSQYELLTVLGRRLG